MNPFPPDCSCGWWWNFLTVGVGKPRQVLWWGYSGGSSDNFQLQIMSNVCQLYNTSLGFLCLLKTAFLFATLVWRLLNQCFSAFFSVAPPPRTGETLIP